MCHHPGINTGFYKKSLCSETKIILEIFFKFFMSSFPLAIENNMPPLSLKCTAFYFFFVLHFNDTFGFIFSIVFSMEFLNFIVFLCPLLGETAVSHFRFDKG